MDDTIYSLIFEVEICKQAIQVCLLTQITKMQYLGGFIGESDWCLYPSEYNAYGGAILMPTIFLRLCQRSPCCF